MDKEDSYYDCIAEGYDELYKEEQIRKLERMWNIGNAHKFFFDQDKILDVGCGTGISSDFFAEKGFEVFGIDPAQKLIDNNSHKGKLSQLSKAFAEDIPFEDDFFDLVVSVTAIQNFYDLKKGIEEMRRVGKDRFIISFLAKVKNQDVIEGLIEKIFQVLGKDEGKDIIYFLRK